MKHWAWSVALAATLASAAPLAHAAGFTYHGSLDDGGQPANGRYDLRVTPYASEQATAPTAAAVTLYGVEVKDGRFSTDLDFAANVAPDGWLGVAVRRAGSGDFVELAGRSEIAAADACWSTTGNAIGSSGGFLGTLDNQPLYMLVNNRFGAAIRNYTDGVSFEVGNSGANAAHAVAFNHGQAYAVDSFAAGRSSRVPVGADRSFVWGGRSFTTDADRVESSGPDQFVVYANGGFMVNTASIFASDDVVFAPRGGPNADPGLDIRLLTRDNKSGMISLRNSDGRMDLSAMGGVHIIGPTSVGDLKVDGAASKATAGAWQANSDGRIKQDIAPIDDALDTLAKVRPVTFRYTDAYRAEHPQVADQRYYNVVAQEFASVFPDAVTLSGEYLPGAAKTADNEILQVDTYPAQIVTIAAVQELARRNAALQATVEQLMARIAKLEAKGK